MIVRWWQSLLAVGVVVAVGVYVALTISDPRGGIVAKALGGIALCAVAVLLGLSVASAWKRYRR